MSTLDFISAMEAYKVFNDASSIAWRQDLKVNFSIGEWCTLQTLLDRMCEQLIESIEPYIKGDKDEPIT